MRLVLTALIGAGVLWAMPGAAGEVAGATQALNAFRADNGRKPVTHSEVLQRIAEGHSQDMSRKGFFSHTGSNGSDLKSRAKAGGYGFCFAAENIAKGQRDLAEVMASWAGSKGHNCNMKHRKVREFGLARTDGNVWVMVLGATLC